MEAT
jgi:26S proteasome regulatory subunit N1